MKKLLIITALALLVVRTSIACTNFLVTKGASADGSTMISYNADSHSLYGELYFYPAATYGEGVWRDIYEWDTGKYLGRIPQSRQTFSVVGNMNEYQVSIAETTFGGRDGLNDEKAIMDYGSLIYVALQRSKTAREAIKIMTDLVKEYGYYSTGESFSIADPNEVWIMEMVGKGKGNKGALWVALRIPDGYVCAHANHPRITTFPTNDPQNCLYSDSVITFARKKGWFTGEDKNFSFSDTYAPLDFSGQRFCEARVWSFFRHVNKDMEKFADYAKGISKERMPLWIKPDQKLSVQDVERYMRDHYEGTDLDMSKDAGAGPYQCPYRWRPMTWSVDGQNYLHERAISTQQTGFTFVAQMRATLPNMIGGILWFGVDDSYCTVYVPMYCGIKSAPYNYAVGTGNFNEFTWESAFWVFNFVANYTYTRFSDMIQDVQKQQNELEGAFFANQAAIEQNASTLYKTSPEQAREYLTKYSHEQAATTVAKWKKLGETLIFKYLDGNPKDEYNKPTHPKYPDNWYRVIVKDAGEKIKAKE